MLAWEDGIKPTKITELALINIQDKLEEIQRIFNTLESVARLTKPFESILIYSEHGKGAHITCGDWKLWYEIRDGIVRIIDSSVDQNTLGYLLANVANYHRQLKKKLSEAASI